MGVPLGSEIIITIIIIATRKLFTLHKCFSRIDDVGRLYVPRTLGGRGLLSVQDTVSIEVAAIAVICHQSRSLY